VSSCQVCGAMAAVLIGNPPEDDSEEEDAPHWAVLCAPCLAKAMAWI
jgi:hypothetical protein